MTGIENSQIEGLLNDIIEQQTLITDFFASTKVKFTLEGGLAIKLTNKTGSASVKGTIVKPHATIDNAFNISGTDEFDSIGAVYDDGIEDGELCWIIVAGIAEVLLEDGTAATRGYWARTSTTQAGRVTVNTATQPGLLQTHFAEVGHGLENVSSGTDVLAKISMHFL
jgi:hypothetical protein